jgi:hypothetical protein
MAIHKKIKACRECAEDVRTVCGDSVLAFECCMLCTVKVENARNTQSVLQFHVSDV